MTTDSLKLEAQAVLDELLREQELPFKLEAQKVVAAGEGRYTIRFFDSRLHSITVSWEAGESFKEVVRAAVLDRVSRLSGPLHLKQL